MVVEIFRFRRRYLSELYISPGFLRSQWRYALSLHVLEMITVTHIVEREACPYGTNLFNDIGAWRS